MSKIGRNESCPCGSGKKYKKCCGKNGVVSIMDVIYEEIEKQEEQLYRYMYTHYRNEREKLFREVEGKTSVFRENEMNSVLLFDIWFTTAYESKGTTILESFVEYQLPTIHRPRTKAIVESWKEALFVAGMIQEVTDTHITMVDELSNETYQVQYKNRSFQPHTFVTGVLLPYEETYKFYIFGYDFPKEVADVAVPYLKEQIAAYEGDVQSYFREHYLTFIDDVFTKLAEKENASQEEEQPTYEWEKEIYREIGDDLQAFIQEVGGSKDASDFGVLLWNVFSKKVQPTIRNPKLYVAATYYLLQSLAFDLPTFTQKELAERFGVSPNSISQRRKEMDAAVAEQVASLSS
ncbi:MAG: SEC-C domain-containing protein [Bacillus sp. (in: Bacteria)]|nr:SEC-C domain-containing protein [Bacillus sp. (in: firmicutes)]